MSPITKKEAKNAPLWDAYTAGISGATYGLTTGVIAHNHGAATFPGVLIGTAFSAGVGGATGARAGMRMKARVEEGRLSDRRIKQLHDKELASSHGKALLSAVAPLAGKGVLAAAAGIDKNLAMPGKIWRPAGIKKGKPYLGRGISPLAVNINRGDRAVTFAEHHYLHRNHKWPAEKGDTNHFSFTNAVRISATPIKSPLLKVGKLHESTFVKGIGFNMKDPKPEFESHTIYGKALDVRVNPVKAAAIGVGVAGVTAGGVYGYKHRSELKAHVHQMQGKASRFIERHPIRKP